MDRMIHTALNSLKMILQNQQITSQNISNWDVGSVKNLSGVFVRSQFNGDISNWDVSNVRDMLITFASTTHFNADISRWDVSNVKTMHAMFDNAFKFDQNINNWDVSNVEDMSEMGKSYHMPSFVVDGMSVEAVHYAIQEACERARKGEGPTLLDIRTYRYKGHSMSDPQKYRSKDEVEDYKQKDPISQVLKTIEDAKLFYSIVLST